MKDISKILHPAITVVEEKIKRFTVLWNKQSALILGAQVAGSRLGFDEPNIQAEIALRNQQTDHLFALIDALILEYERLDYRLGLLARMCRTPCYKYGIIPKLPHASR